jgi:hypothetical protein
VLARAAGLPFVDVAHEPTGPHAEAVRVPAGSPLRSVAERRGKRRALNVDLGRRSRAPATSTWDGSGGPEWGVLSVVVGGEPPRRDRATGLATTTDPGNQQPQQTGIPFIITQQVQPAFIMVAQQSQHAWIMAQHSLSPLVQVMQTPISVGSHLHMPITRLQQQAIIPFIIMPQLHMPPAIIVQRFWSMPAETVSSQTMVIFMPPAHFSKVILQRGTIAMFMPGADAPAVPIIPDGDAMPMPDIIPIRSVIIPVIVLLLKAVPSQMGASRRPLGSFPHLRARADSRQEATQEKNEHSIMINSIIIIPWVKLADYGHSGLRKSVSTADIAGFRHRARRRGLNR